MCYHTVRIAFCLIPLLVFLINTHSVAQHRSEQTEMDRLEHQAYYLAAQADPEGAALAIGKAAMMADLLTKETPNPTAKNFFQSASHLYRAQELGLRALALFERTAGNLPAPPIVCQYLNQGKIKLGDSRDLLENAPGNSQEDIKRKRDHLHTKNEEWQSLLQGLDEDFGCSATPSK